MNPHTYLPVKCQPPRSINLEVNQIAMEVLCKLYLLVLDFLRIIKKQAVVLLLTSFHILLRIKIKKSFLFLKKYCYLAPLSIKLDCNYMFRNTIFIIHTFFQVTQIVCVIQITSTLANFKIDLSKSQLKWCNPIVICWIFIL